MSDLVDSAVGVATGLLAMGLVVGVASKMGLLGKEKKSSGGSWFK